MERAEVALLATLPAATAGLVALSTEWPVTIVDPPPFGREVGACIRQGATWRP